MIPLKDEIPSEHPPLMTWLLILVNVFGYIWAPASAQYSLHGYNEGVLPFLTFNFIHANLGHLISNMWALWLFGDNVEDRMGKFKFLFFYLCMGALAGLIQLRFTESGSMLLGASGAVAGVMGAYVISFPGSRILTLIPIIIFPLFIKIPAILYLLLWFLAQISPVISGYSSNIAWFAHIGGFLGGILFHRLFIKKEVSGEWS